MKIMTFSFKRSSPHTASLSAPSPAAGHCWPTPPPETSGHSQAHLGPCLLGSLLLSPGCWYTQGFVYALQESVSPGLCKFWWLYDGVNGGLLQEGLCHTQVYCIQRPWPCSSPLQIHTSTGDPQTPFWFCLYGISGSWCIQGLFEPSEHLWRVWGLVLNVIFPLLPSCWGFPFALGRGVSFFGGIQHSPFDGCSAASFNFGVLTGEDEYNFFYSVVLEKTQVWFPRIWEGPHKFWIQVILFAQDKVSIEGRAFG